MIAIDKNVPIPPRRRGRAGGRLAKYPWLALSVGDSFFAPGAKPNSISSGATLAGKRYCLKFTIRKEGDGVRVWRIA